MDSKQKDNSEANKKDSKDQKPVSSAIAAPSVAGTAKNADKPPQATARGVSTNNANNKPSAKNGKDANGTITIGHYVLGKFKQTNYA